MAPPDPERVLFRGDVVEVGVFTCPPGHPRFPGGAVDGCLVAFPHTSVIIEQQGAAPVLADPNVAVFYNPRSAYSRYEVDERGDLCDWIGVGSGWPDDDGTDGDRLFAFTHGPVPSEISCPRER